MFTYSVAYFLAKHLGFGHHEQLIVITLATVAMFNLNFWSVSEAVIEYEADIED